MVYPRTTGSSATSLAYVNGFVMVRDAIAGRIDHALTLTLPVTGDTAIAAGVACTRFVAPARRCDTSSFLKSGVADRRVADGIPEGTLYRLPASFDIAAHAPGDDDRSRFLRMLLTAIRDYGMYVSDTSPTLNINAEGTAVIAQDTAYHDIRKAQVPAWWGKAGIFSQDNNVLQSMPWSSMQVVMPKDWRSFP